MSQEFRIALVGSNEIGILNHHVNNGLVFFHVGGVNCLDRYLWQTEKCRELVFFILEIRFFIEYICLFIFILFFLLYNLVSNFHIFFCKQYLMVHD